MFKSIHYLWIYLTEKCNLDCDYCFFRGRSKNATLTIENIETLVNIIEPQSNLKVVISGGEPLLEYNLFKKTLMLLQRKFPSVPVTLQTNGLLIDRLNAEFLKKNNVSVELGMDGDLRTMQKHRRGMDKKKFDKLKESINILRDFKVKIYVTMTVRPQEVGSLFRNFSFITDLGLINIDLSPAIFTEWNRSSFLKFKKEYLKIIHFLVSTDKRRALDIYYDLPYKRELIDLCLVPPGLVLPNWTCLALPRDKKMKYAIMNITTGRLSVREEFYRLNNMCKRYRSSSFTYRDYSLLNAQNIFQDIGKLEKSNLKYYIKICSFMKIVNQKFFNESLIHRKLFSAY